jgi:hypothetical protein
MTHQKQYAFSPPPLFPFFLFVQNASFSVLSIFRKVIEFKRGGK